MESSFIYSLMKNVLEGTMIPKVQIERAIGPILTMFLAEVLTEAFCNNPDLSGRYEMICPEFPFRKDDCFQSTNVDWLMFNTDRKQLVLVELKTSDSSANDEQSRIYRQVKRAVINNGGEFLLKDIAGMRDSSQEYGKYEYILENKVRLFSSRISDCRDARIVYIVPESIARRVEVYADAVLWFSKLPAAIRSPFAAEWRTIQEKLCILDSISKSSRNGNFSASGNIFGGNRKNYYDKGKLPSIIRLCKEYGNGIVIGFTGGKEALENADVNGLSNRDFKWDYKNGGAGKKEPKNWICGQDFMEIIKRVQNKK